MENCLWMTVKFQKYSSSGSGGNFCKLFSMCVTIHTRIFWIHAIQWIYMTSLKLRNLIVFFQNISIIEIYDNFFAPLMNSLYSILHQSLVFADHTLYLGHLSIKGSIWISPATKLIINSAQHHNSFCDRMEQHFQNRQHFQFSH